jgi:hypothetical protein
MAYNSEVMRAPDQLMIHFVTNFNFSKSIFRLVLEMAIYHLKIWWVVAIICAGWAMFLTRAKHYLQSQND